MPAPNKMSVKGARARRENAILRGELRLPSSERVASGGVTSMAVKAEDPAVRNMIDDFLARRQT